MTPHLALPMIRFSLRKKLTTLVLLAIIPLLAISFYLILALKSYSNFYNAIVRNMTVANGYNLNFKNEIDEALYRQVSAGEPFPESAVPDPYSEIAALRSDFARLETITTDENSRSWLETLLRNIDTLEDRVDDIQQNLLEGGHYTDNIDMLENNIYILTELIQDDIQYYIYYQTESIENLQTALNRSLRTFVLAMSVVLVLAVALLVAVETRILRSVTSSVEDVDQTARRIATGDFSARSNVQSHDELAVLGRNINDMAGSLQEMVDRIRDDEKRMRHAELRLLQEQINPHFLYNTLDTIVWLIEGGKSEEAEDMVLSLSNFFRLVLSHGKEIITIREEEQHIRSYLEIQQVRYRDILSYEINIDPSIHHYCIQKLTLQPIVENALYHGIKEKRDRGNIRITGTREQDNIRLVVEDDGAGMEEEEVDRLREEIQKPCKETCAGFGLANVNERIRMRFGPQYGLQIESRKGAGTVITILIPAQEPVQEEA